MTRQKVVPALTQRLLSNVRDVIGNFKKMLKPWGGQEQFPFFLQKCNSGGQHTVILKLTLRHKTDVTDRAAADFADFASACRFRSFRRFYLSFFRNFPVMLIVLDH